MRLGQLARKLAMRPAEIVTFLSQQHIAIESGGNTRLEDEHVGLIMRKFAPELSEEKIIEAIAQGEEAASRMDNTPVANTDSAESVAPADIQSPSGESPEEKIELIKAPKVELSGLRVLGKIDLPENKKKEVPPTVESTETAPPSTSDKRRPYQPRRERASAPSQKNPIALQREREAHEAEERRRAEIERDKEKRALHYRKKVKVAPPSKRVRMVDEPVEELSAAELMEPPKTWLGKFLRWLNT